MDKLQWLKKYHFQGLPIATYADSIIMDDGDQHFNMHIGDMNVHLHNIK